ncbi:MAG TPA: hypothetical protein VIH90_08280 [Candidatus Saccharimonadales bacterium]
MTMSANSFEIGPDCFKPCAEPIPQQALDTINRDAPRFVSVARVGIPQVVDYPDAGKTYLELYEELYDRGTPGITDFKSLRLVDLSESGEVMGYGVVTLWTGAPPNDEMQTTPFVDITRTHDKFARQGLGRRRLLVMNAASRRFFNLPLSASSVITDDALRLWQKLEVDGLVIKSEDTYRFIS